MTAINQPRSAAQNRHFSDKEPDNLMSIAEGSPHPRIAYRVLELILWALGCSQTDLPQNFGLNTDLEDMGADQICVDDILIELGNEFGFDDLSESEAKLNGRTAQAFIALVLREALGQSNAA